MMTIPRKGSEGGFGVHEKERKASERAGQCLDKHALSLD
jgi:hypothetical protein